jgi:cytochrome c oxidase subunit 4
MATHNDHSHEYQSDVPQPHVGSKLIYFLVFGALIVGSVLTVWAAFQDLGVFNAPIALTIATTKAVLVILFFMHVKDSSRLTKTTVIAGAFWLGILFVLTMGDYVSRLWH